MRLCGFSVVLTLGLFAGAVGGGTLEDLSQGSHFIWTLGKGCSDFDRGRANQGLDRAECSETGFQRQTHNLNGVSASVEEQEENRLFEQLALAQAKQLRCGETFAKDLAGDKDPTAAAGIVNRIRLLREARIQVDEAIKALTANGMDQLSLCPKDMPSGLSTYIKKCNEYFTAIAAFYAIGASIPMANSKAVGQVVDKYIHASARQVLGGLDGQLESSLRKAYGHAADELDTASTQLETTVKQSGGAGFGRFERHALLADPAINKQVVQTMGGGSDAEGLVCRADSRFGSGADELSSSVAIGSLLLTGGGAVLMRAGSLAADVAEAAIEARSVGTLSLNAMSMLRASAVGLGGVGSIESVVQSCHRPMTHISGACASAPQIDDIGADNCALSVALASIGFTGVAGKLGLAAWKRLRAPGVVTVEDVASNSAPATETAVPGKVVAPRSNEDIAPVYNPTIKPATPKATIVKAYPVDDPEIPRRYNPHVTKEDGFEFVPQIEDTPSTAEHELIADAITEARKRNSGPSSLRYFLQRLGVHPDAVSYALNHPNDDAVKTLKQLLKAGYNRRIYNVVEYNLGTLKQHAVFEGLADVKKAIALDRKVPIETVTDPQYADARKKVLNLLKKFAAYRPNQDWNLSHLRSQTEKGNVQFKMWKCDGCESLGVQGMQKIKFTSFFTNRPVKNLAYGRFL